jgi:hypothetical protein
MREAHERDMLARLERDPPAAFVFLDRSPLMSSADAALDFERHCPRTTEWLQGRYVETADFGGMHVWMRSSR